MLKSPGHGNEIVNRSLLMNRQMSRLQKLRAEHKPELPKILQNLHNIQFQKGTSTTSVGQKEEIKKSFPKTYGRPILTCKEGDLRASAPLKVGVVLSGGQAAGGH